MCKGKNRKRRLTNADCQQSSHKTGRRWPEAAPRQPWTWPSCAGKVHSATTLDLAILCRKCARRHSDSHFYQQNVHGATTGATFRKCARRHNGSHFYQKMCTALQREPRYQNVHGATAGATARVAASIRDPRSVMLSSKCTFYNNRNPIYFPKLHGTGTGATFIIQKSATTPTPANFP